MNREQLVKRAADAIANTTDHPGLGHVDWPDQFDAVEIAKVCWAVFEEAHAPSPCPVCHRADGSHKLDCRPQNRRDAAHAPTDDEREALIAEADALVESWDRRGSWSSDSPVGLVMRLAAYLRRTVQGEPSDATLGVMARHMAQAALDWIDIEGGGHEHDLECTNWQAYVDDARAALRAAAEVAQEECHER